MKKKDFIQTVKASGILFGAAALLLAACTNDSEGTDTPADARVALQVSSGINVNTRAHDDVWEKDDAIGIYMLNNTTVEAANKKYTTTSTTASGTFSPAGASEAIYFPVEGNRDFIAYYPHSTTLTGTTYNVNVATQSSQKAIDLMGAAKVTDKDKENPAVAFNFTHKLVKIDLTIQADASLGVADLTGLTVTLTGQQTSGTYDVVAGGDVAVTTGTPTGITLLTAANGTTSEAIVLPNTNTADMELVFKLSGGDTFSWAVKNAAKSQKFEAGKKYLYTITLNRTGLAVTASITDWTLGNEDGETGSAE